MESTASVPLAAWPTMSKPDSSSIWTSILRTWAVSSTTKTRTDMQGSYTVPALAPGPRPLRIEAVEALQDRDQEVGGRPGRVSGSGRGDLGNGRRRRGRSDGDRGDRGLDGDDHRCRDDGLRSRRLGGDGPGGGRLGGDGPGRRRHGHRGNGG